MYISGYRGGKALTVKRAFSFAFTLVFIVGMLSFFPAPVRAEAVIIKNIEPAILALTDSSVNLSNYSVEFSDGSVREDISWWFNNSEITSFEVAQAGVYPLIAVSGGFSEIIYIVAKNPADNEYILYFNDFTDKNALDDWNRQASGDGVFGIDNGKLTVDGLIGANPRIYLPEWLASFGNYRIDVVGTQIDPTDSSRWFSVMFRAGNAATTGLPYYHMAVRNNMTLPGSATTGGIELCSNTGTWNYYKSTGYKENVNAAKDYTFSVLAKDSIVQLQVNGNVVIHLDELPMIADTYKGGIGLQANSSKLVVDSIKITILEEAPEYSEPEIEQILSFVENPESNILNTPTNIAIIDSMETLQSIQEGVKPSNALLYTDKDLNINTKDGTRITDAENALELLGNNIIPAFYVADKEAADAVGELLIRKDIVDALLIGADEATAAYIADSYVFLRNAVDFSGSQESPTEERLLEIRRATTRAGSLIAILPYEYAVSDHVYYLQSLGVSVWIIQDNLKTDVQIATMITSGANGLITNNHKRVADSFTAMFERNTMTKTPLIIGHRGNPTQAPENSISGYLKAIENGADVVETDIKITKDGHVIIMHDGTLTRTTTYTGSADVSSMTLEEIKKYSLWGQNNQFKDDYPDEKVPTFEEMLIALKDSDAKIFLEIKTGELRIIEPTVNLIKQYGYEDRIFVICFSSAQINAFRKAMPTIGTGLLLQSIPAFTTEADMHDVLYQNYQLFHGCRSTFNPWFGSMTKDMFSALRHRGITCWPWTYTVAYKTQFNNNYLWGVDGLTTDDAQYSLNMVKKLDSSDKAISVKTGGTAQITLDKVTYGRVSSSILEDRNTFITFIEGEDVISYENGTVTALKAGSASFMLGYKARTAEGNTYVLYTQPFTVSVHSEYIPVEDENGKTLQTVIIIGAILLLIAGGAFVIGKKKKDG